MEEKKPVKISLTTFIVVIIILALVIVVLGVYIVKLKKEANTLVPFTTTENNSDGWEEPLTTSDTTNNASTKEMTPAEAEKKEKKKYEFASNLFRLNNIDFVVSAEGTKIDEKDEDSMMKYEITNYNEVVNKYLTENAKKYFDQKAICVVIKDGKAYEVEGGEPTSQNGGIEFTNIQSTENKITATVKMDIIEPEEEVKNLGTAETKFELEKVNNEWKISEYKDESDFENWDKVVWNN